MLQAAGAAQHGDFATASRLDRPAEALPLAERVYALRREMQGERHAATLSSMNELAMCHRSPAVWAPFILVGAG
jgi:hypothetical protein